MLDPILDLYLRELVFRIILKPCSIQISILKPHADAQTLEICISAHVRHDKLQLGILFEHGAKLHREAKRGTLAGGCPDL